MRIDDLYDMESGGVLWEKWDGVYREEKESNYGDVKWGHQIVDLEKYKGWSDVDSVHYVKKEVHTRKFVVKIHRILNNKMVEYIEYA